MENTETQKVETPMGRVWAIVLLSMCVTFALSWFWHVGGIEREISENSAADAAVVLRTEEVARYRDMLKEKGKVAAEASLVTN